MAYNDDAVLAKLSALNETQESIVSTALASEAMNARLIRFLGHCRSMDYVS